MISLRQWPISRRILLIGTLPAFIAVLLVTTYQMFQRWNELRADSELSTETAMALMAEAAYYPVMSGNFELIDPWADQTLKHLTIASITIIDEKGDVRYNRKAPRYKEIPSQELQSLSVPISWAVSLEDESLLLGGALEAEEKTPPVGRREVRFEVTNLFLNEREQDILLHSFVVGLSVVFLSMLAAGTISTTIIPPLIEVSQFIGKLASDEAIQPIRVDNGAEIGALQRGANRLARSLEKAEKNQEKYLRRIQAEQKKSLQASQAKSDFLAMMSHELRTPLNGISGTLELINLQNSPEEFSDYKSMADQSLRNLTQMLEDVLVMVDMEKSVLKEKKDEHNLRDILEVLIHEFREKAIQKQLSLIVEYDDYLIDKNLSVDPSLVRQVVRHLVDNAIKFTDQGYVIVRLSLLLQGRQDWLAIQVTDTGIGIPADRRMLVLQAFSQGDFSFSRAHDGLGLGLTITNYICQSLGGSIVLRDNGGRGTDVMVSIPVVLPQKEKQNETAVNVIEHSLTVMVVEDNAVNLRVAEGMVKRAAPGSTVLLASTGDQCLANEQLGAVDLILMDCQMPGLDGFETTRRLRQLGYSMSIVACTANSSEYIQSKCLEAGMDAFLAKPLSVNSMRTTLKKWGKSPRFLPGC